MKIFKVYTALMYLKILNTVNDLIYLCGKEMFSTVLLKPVPFTYLACVVFSKPLVLTSYSTVIMKVAFDVQHLYYLPQYLPVIEQLTT